MSDCRPTGLPYCSPVSLRVLIRHRTEMQRYPILLLLTYPLLVISSASEAEQGKCEHLATTGGARKFPAYFSFGVSTAAYQIEGAWNADGKGASIWDTFTHEHPELIDDHTNGDIGPDSYHQFDQDLEALKSLKVKFYRFSIAWSRILPNGDISSKNQKGIDYYNMMIDKLLAAGIEPVVTMMHYDLPEELNKFGGFTNDMTIEYFRYYADTLFQLYGDRVKLWITFNEPFDFCIPGYGDASYPPMISGSGITDYMCMDITLKAHVVAYRLYKAKYFGTQRGKIGITLSSRFYFTKANDGAALVDRGMQYALGWLAHPLYGKSGNYPYTMLEDILRNSVREGRAWSRLRPLTDMWLENSKGAADFLGLNYYTSRYVEQARPPQGKIPSWEYDSAMKYTLDPNWKRAKSNWLYCVPSGLEGILKWIRDNYDNVEVIITENGWSDDGQLNDEDRIDYLKAHLQAVLNAVNDGCNVTRYTHWSLLDNFEWRRGYTEKFGLYFVNRTSERKERIAKASAAYYKSVIETGKV